MALKWAKYTAWSSKAGGFKLGSARGACKKNKYALTHLFSLFLFFMLLY